MSVGIMGPVEGGTADVEVKDVEIKDVEIKSNVAYNL